ncbi:MAG: hypothetical protein L0I33_05925 [Acetobacter sp.]|nr:hypothetical protein [Acetobacter sp.]
MPLTMHSAPMWRRFAFASVASIALLPVISTLAIAQTATFAHSKHHNVEINFADPTTACAASTLRLTMQITPQSQEIDTLEQQLHLANALGSKLSTDSNCNNVQSVDLAVMQNGTQTHSLHATRSDNWKFVEAAPATNAAQEVPTQESTTTPSAAPIPQPEAPPPAIPDGYMGLLALLVQKNPALLGNEAVQTCWARHFFEQDYINARGNDFRQHEVANKAKLDLERVSHQSASGQLHADLTLNLGQYDFNTSSFPVVLDGSVLSLSSNCDLSAAQLPNQVSFKLGEDNFSFPLPMPSAQAEQFLKQRTRYGYINRDMPVTLFFSVAEPELAKLNTPDFHIVPAELTSVKIYNDNARKELLGTIGAETLAGMRKAQADAQAAHLAKEAAQKRAENLRMMSERVQSANRSEKLAMWVGQDHNGYGLPSLDTMRSVRTSASLRNQPVPAILLVQTDSSGRKQVETKWPGKLTLTVPQDQPALSSGTWYIVQGQVSVPSKGDFPDATMAVQTLHACTQDQCKDAEDPQALATALQAQTTH